MSTQQALGPTWKRVDVTRSKAKKLRRDDRDYARAMVWSVAAALTLASVYLSPSFPLSHSVVEMLVVFLPVGGMLGSHRKLHQRRVPTSVLAVVFAFLLVVALSTITNPITDIGLVKTLSPAISALILAITGGLMNRRELLAVGRMIIVLALVQTFLAIMEVQAHAAWAMKLAVSPDVGYYFIRENLVLHGYLRAAGTMGHPILLGVVCSIGTLFLLLKDGVRLPMAIRVPLISLFAWGVLLSGSRSCLAALGAAMIIYLLHRNTALSRGWRRLVLVAVVPLVWLYVKGAAREAQTVSPLSLSNRQASLGRIVDALDRTGLSYMFGESNNFTLPTVADNQLLTTVGMYGLCGLAIVAVAAAAGVFARSAMVAAIAAFLVTMFLSFDVLQFGFTGALFWFAFGASRVKSPAAIRRAPRAPDPA